MGNCKHIECDVGLVGNPRTCATGLYRSVAITQPHRQHERVELQIFGHTQALSAQTFACIKRVL
jgi:hypothetical protein